MLFSINKTTPLTQKILKEVNAFITQQQRLFTINHPHVQGSEKSFNRFIKYASAKAMNITSNKILQTLSNPTHVTKQHTSYDKVKNTQRLCEYFNSAARFDHIPFFCVNNGLKTKNRPANNGRAKTLTEICYD